MQLITEEIRKTLPALYACEDEKDPIARVKFFTPWTSWTWYAVEFDPDTRTFFGLVVGQETELGYFNLDELESLTGPMGLKIERDLMALFPRTGWTLLSHLLIWHGRRVCGARKPDCGACVVADHCPSRAP